MSGILQLRIYALYPTSRILIRLMIAFFLMFSSASAVIIGIFVSTFKGEYPLIKGEKLHYFYVPFL